MYSFKNDYVILQVEEQDQTLTLTGVIENPGDFKQMEVFAANPIDRMMNYSGSGLPFPTPSIAFENTPNVYQVDPKGTIQTQFQTPNAYYTQDKQTLVQPSLFIKLVPKNDQEPIFVRFQLENKLPLKTLYHRDRTQNAYPGRTEGPMFYQRKADVLGVQGQEAILRQTAVTKANYYSA